MSLQEHEVVAEAIKAIRAAHEALIAARQLETLGGLPEVTRAVAIVTLAARAEVQIKSALRSLEVDYKHATPNHDELPF